LARIIIEKHQPLWLSDQHDRSGLAGDGGFGGEVECRGVTLPGVGPLAKNRERGPGIVLNSPSFFHPQRANHVQQDGPTST